jgi:plasmid stabilization system protein ParE
MSGMRSVLVHPYVIFFQVAASSVEIVRGLHQRRDLESIFADDVDG